jgi:hypothetical protein
MQFTLSATFFLVVQSETERKRWKDNMVKCLLQLFDLSIGSWNIYVTFSQIFCVLEIFHNKNWGKIMYPAHQLLSVSHHIFLTKLGMCLCSHVEIKISGDHGRADANGSIAPINHSFTRHISIPGHLVAESMEYVPLTEPLQMWVKHKSILMVHISLSYSQTNIKRHGKTSKSKIHLQHSF